MEIVDLDNNTFSEMEETEKFLMGQIWERMEGEEVENIQRNETVVEGDDGLTE